MRMLYITRHWGCADYLIGKDQTDLGPEQKTLADTPQGAAIAHAQKAFGDMCDLNARETMYVEVRRPDAETTTRFCVIREVETHWTTKEYRDAL